MALDFEKGGRMAAFFFAIQAIAFIDRHSGLRRNDGSLEG